MVKIRLRRVGAKKQPHYRIVVADSKAPRDGKFIETIGHYNPRTEPVTMEVDTERALYWLGVGAQPSEAVKRMLDKLGILAQAAAIKRGEVPVARATPPAEPVGAKAKVFKAEEEALFVEKEGQEEEEPAEAEEWGPEVAVAEESEDLDEDWDLDVEEDEDFDDELFEEEDDE